MKEIAILYSGGTDSTAAAVLMSKEFDKVHLLTYQRFGIFSIKNSSFNYPFLENKFGKDKFIHKILKVDRLFKEISYVQYGKNLKKYGFFLLATCELCKLTMHLRTLVYCLENNIKAVACGANKNMIFFPDQTPECMVEIRKFYARYGISYFNPVYDFDCPEEDIDWIHKLGLNDIRSALKMNEPSNKEACTTSRFLFNEGVIDVRNIKALKRGQKMQPRCFQFTLFNIFLHWYFLPAYGFDKYKGMAVDLCKCRIDYFTSMVDEYLARKNKSRLFELIK